MLLNDFFILDESLPGEGRLQAKLRVDPGHRILEGHFPGRPVVPGACLVQLVQELAAQLTDKPIRLTAAGPVKFIAMIEPGRDPVLEMTLRTAEQTGDEWQIVAEARNAGAVCFRFRGTFRAGSDYVD